MKGLSNTTLALLLLVVLVVAAAVLYQSGVFSGTSGAAGAIGGFAAAYGGAERNAWNKVQTGDAPYLAEAEGHTHELDFEPEAEPGYSEETEGHRHHVERGAERSAETEGHAHDIKRYVSARQ